VLFHGGSWSGGDEDGLEDRARHLAAHGLAVAAVRYRLASGMQPARFPAQASDARCAVRVLRGALAPRHHLDPGRILAGGFSAGGHLATLIALADGPEAVAALDDGSCPDGTTSAAVQGAFGWYAPLDLRGDAPAGDDLDRILRNFLGAPPRSDPEVARRASPVAWASPGDPPVLLVHGEDDELVPIGQSRRLRDALAKSEVPGALVRVPGLGHGFRMFGQRPGERRGTCATLAFLNGLTSPSGSAGATLRSN
jgi:acetyl esterase/lipase